MSNIESDMRTEKKAKLESTLLLVDAITQLSRDGLSLLEAENYSEFNTLLEERKEKIAKFADLKDQLQNGPALRLTVHEKQEMNELIRAKVEILAKVDQEIFDIMKYKRSELLRKMSQANQGKNFLKSFKKQVNSEKTFSRMV